MIPAPSPTAPGQKIPPKLQQLLALMPDVDKVNLLHLARHYNMDLDDPGFLPMLILKEGIAALEAFTKSLSVESEKTATLILSRACAAINETGEAEKAALVRLRDEADIYIKQMAADADKALHEALLGWSDETLHSSIAAALVENSRGATAEAERIAIGAATGFAKIANDAAKASNQAAINCNAVNDAMSKTQPLFIALVFTIGVLVGVAGLFFIKTPKSGDVYLDAPAIAKQIVSECRKNPR